MKNMHFIILLGYIAASYSVYFIFNTSVVTQLGNEDGFFENITFFYFLTAAIIFLKNFRQFENKFYFMLFLVFFIGAGEEISWGQRIFNFGTPEIVEKINVQKEFNLHNLKYFNSNNFDHQPKEGILLYLSINYLFKLFWFLYCVIIPIIARYNSFFFKFFKRINLPVPSMRIGLLFLFNWFIFKFMISFYLIPRIDELGYYYNTVVEISESNSALIFMILAYYFLNLERTKTEITQLVG